MGARAAAPATADHTPFAHALKPSRCEADANPCGECLRENALCAFMAAAGCATIAWLGLYGFAWNDYEIEARPAFEALVARPRRGVPAARAGLRRLADRARAVRAAARAVGRRRARGLPHGRAALPARRGRARRVARRADARTRPSRRSRARSRWGLRRQPDHAAGARTRATPRSCSAPCLCVAAVLLAGLGDGRAHPLLAGAALGLAIANKEWALLALGPGAARAPRPAPAALPGGATRVAARDPRAAGARRIGRLRGEHACGAAPAPSAIFQPWQVWWFFGHHGALVHGLFGAPKPGYRVGPGMDRRDQPSADPARRRWRSRLALWLRSRGSGSLSVQDALLALALVLLLRCVLDTWDTVYYPLPFVLRAARLGGRAPGRRPPLLALLAHRARVAQLPVAADACQRRCCRRRSSSPGRCRWALCSACALFAPGRARRSASQRGRGRPRSTLRR